MVQWLTLQAANARDMSSIPGRPTKTPYALWHGQQIKKKKKFKMAKDTWLVSGRVCLLIHNPRHLVLI